MRLPLGDGNAPGALNTRSLLSRLGFATAVLALAACASGGSRLASFFYVDKGDEPWEIPADSYATQSLYRVRYDGPEGRLSFKLTLYLVDKNRFRMRAADGLGRKLWDLAVDADDQALWLDHRNKEYCEARGASRLAIVPLARLPLVALPRLLLGRMPAPPASELKRSAVGVAFRDARGQLWNGGLEDGRLLWWTLVENGQAVTWWRQEDGEGIFTDLVGHQKLIWREVVHEALRNSPGPLRVPEPYREGACGNPSQ